MKISDKEFTARKGRKKLIRVIFEIIILVGIAAICINALFTLKTYEAFSAKNSKISQDRGFVALSYFGVERIGNQSVIGEGRLREQLKALKNLGYVTVTQQDILDYYQSGKKLPEKSLFLIFEDGRRDTAIFSQKILEDLNFKATMLTYPEKFKKQDTKFLMPEELKALEKTTFWEMGTNGYRLAFINVFDRYNNYLGEMDPLLHAKVAPYLGRKYNHYLMDYIRDEDGVPKESTAKMKERISYDYETLEDVYNRSLGYIPGVYILMHSNTGSFGNNDKVSSVNEYWIKKLFKMNFNREGFCLNQRNSSIYDLTRMQPQAYWSTNHLLMRMKYDINQDLDFVKGDANGQKAWEIVKGALEIQGDTMILTSLPQDRGLLRLKNSNDFKDMKLSARLKGNKLGLQRIYLRADESLSRFLSVYILNNALYITEKNGSAEKELFKLDLNIHDGQKQLSIPEDKNAAEIQELQTFMQYADSAERAKIYAERLKDKKLENAPSVDEGAEGYVPKININEKGDRMLSLTLKDNQISIQIDGKDAVRDLPVTDTKAGQVYLESAWGDYGWSQRNLADDVYDGVFEKLMITENTGADQEKVLFDGGLQGLEAVKAKILHLWEALLNVFITKL